MRTVSADPELRLQHALETAHRYLNHRDRTVAEVRRQLESRRVEPGTIDQCVAVLEEQGYLDDTRYARLFAEDRRRLDGWGAERIERRLRHYGVPPEQIATTLEELGPADELTAALEVLRARLHGPPSDDRERERALALLVRRGYELDVAYDAVRAFGRT
ncbi:unannotated protein [freshwater metagenome]|uniref:Regulatory protein RecX n=1 Tax=freshwater metagenome TaxID=449393 RepID=A0A6J7DCS5_9ZZZZ|nr:hypothetical protein [Actinomycetota bacterium]